MIGELLWEGQDQYGVHVMRCKGIFVDKESNQTYILQGVEDLFEFRKTTESEKSNAKFLFVVKGNLDSEKFKSEILKRCAE